MVLLLDNYDSFTFNLVDYLHRVGVACKVYKNDDPFETITDNDFRGVIISPGPGRPKDAGNIFRIIDYYQHLPILGICLGHQALGEYFGAKVIKAAMPMHGKISKIKVSPTSIFKGFDHYTNVVRYHSLILDKSPLPECLQTIAETHTGEIMAIRHIAKPIIGIQYHPEAALTHDGLQLMANWRDYYLFAAPHFKSI